MDPAVPQHREFDRLRVISGKSTILICAEFAQASVAPRNRMTRGTRSLRSGGARDLSATVVIIDDGPEGWIG